MAGRSGARLAISLLLCALCIVAGIPSALSTEQPETWDWFPGHGDPYSPPADSPPLFPAPEYPPGGDSPPYDGGSPPYDGGSPPYDGGSPPYDGGSPPYDGGSPPYDGGSPPYDGGSPPYDGGSPPYDGGSPPYDGGSPPYDGGSPPYDGASPPYDGASPPYDGGSPPDDGSSPPYSVEPPTYATPGDPPSEEPIPWFSGCSASYWASTAERWPALYSETTTVPQAFGKEASVHYDKVTLLDALLTTDTDGYSSLMKQGTASLFNSHKKGFQYTTDEVKTQFIGALSSDETAAVQAVKFENANQGYNY